MSEVNAIEVRGLSFSYGTNKVLDNISFNIKKGDFVGIVGPNGSGKTTLVKIILGIFKSAQNKVTIFGNSVNDFSKSGKIGYVPQKFSVEKNFPTTVKEILSLVEKVETFDSIIKKLELTKLLDAKFVELSGGQQQRVITALSLLKNAELLILDEPAVGVDLKGQKEFYNFLHTLNKENGTTIIFVEHDVSMVTKYAKNVLCLNGSICCFGPTEDIGSFLKKVYGEEFHAHHHHH